MALLTFKEKTNKPLMQLYDKFLKEGLKPQRALEKAKEALNANNSSRK